MNLLIKCKTSCSDINLVGKIKEELGKKICTKWEKVKTPLRFGDHTMDQNSQGSCLKF